MMIEEGFLECEKVTEIASFPASHTGMQLRSDDDNDGVDDLGSLSLVRAQRRSSGWVKRVKR